MVDRLRKGTDRGIVVRLICDLTDELGMRDVS